MDLFSHPARIASFQFTQPCLDIERIYAEPRGVNDELSFYIPSDHPQSSRAVKGGDSLYELWSPNCSTTDYYSGAPGQLALASDTVPLPFADGRLGPQDWSLHPQHFSSQAPWIGFCRVAPLAADNWSTIEAELMPLAVVWQHSYSRPGYGRLDDSYASLLGARARHLGTTVTKYECPWGLSLRDDQLQHVLRNRPIYPSPELINYLCSGKYWVWQELVDLLTTVQRGLREMEAWLTMMDYWEQRMEKNVEIPAVRADRIGVWINGASEDEGLWLLRIGVIPVYVIHRYVADVDFPVSLSHISDRRPKNFHSTFVESTQAERLNTADWNSYLKAFQSRSQSYTLPYSPFQLQHDPGIDFGGRGCIRSSSWAFRIKDRARQPTSNIGGSSSSRRDEPHRGSTVARSAFTSDQDQRVAKLVTEGQISFWQPPPVVYGPESRAPAIKNTGRGRKKKKKNKTSWTNFYESNEPGLPVPDGHTAMLLKSKRSGEESDEDSEPESGSSVYGRRTYWDRHRHRRLTFLQPLPRISLVHYDALVYGIPLPDMPYLVNNGNFKYSQQSKSTWAYFDPHPASRSQVGSVPPTNECRPPPPSSATLSMISSPQSPSPTPPRIPVVVDATSSDRDRQKTPAVAPTCLQDDLDMHALANDRATPADVIMEQPIPLDDETAVAIIQDHPKVCASTDISLTPHEDTTMPTMTSESKNVRVRLDLHVNFEGHEEQLDWGIDDEDTCPPNNSSTDPSAPVLTMTLMIIDNAGLSASASHSFVTTDHSSMIVDDIAATKEVLSMEGTDAVVVGMPAQRNNVWHEKEASVLDNRGENDPVIGGPDAVVAGTPVQQNSVWSEREASALGNGGGSVLGFHDGSTTKPGEVPGDAKSMSHSIL